MMQKVYVLTQCREIHTTGSVVGVFTDLTEVQKAIDSEIALVAQGALPWHHFRVRVMHLNNVYVEENLYFDEQGQFLPDVKSELYWENKIRYKESSKVNY